MYETNIETRQVNGHTCYLFGVYFDGKIVGLSDAIYPTKGLAEQTAALYIEAHDRACKYVQKFLQR